MVKKRWATPSTTSSKWTGVRDPRATVRFSLDERVAWDEGDRIVLGAVIGFTEDECAIRVRLENGSTAIWPTVSARLRRVQTPGYDYGGSVATSVELPSMIGEPVVEEHYDEMEVGAHDTIDVTALTEDLSEALTTHVDEGNKFPRRK